MTRPLPAFLSLSLLLAACATQAQTALHPQASRISDAVIQTDQQGYAALQARIQALNASGRPGTRVADYAMAKAQCWLDVSFHEYTRNDRGPFPQAALTESEKLVQALEQGQAPDPATPLVGEAIRLRDDLWARAAALRPQPGGRCATRQTACAEVELVHAGNERAQLGWRHAKPYIQLAEELLDEGEQQAAQCLPPAAPTSPAAPVAVAVAAPALQQLDLVAEVVFAFDRYGEADIRPGSRAGLDALLQRLRSEGWQLQRLSLSGHADRLNRTGQGDYNQRLSERRVATVQALLRAAGLGAVPTQLLARGDEQPVQACAGLRPGPELRECLLPNRRVELRVEATRSAPR